SKTVNGTTTRFLLDGLLEIAEYDGTGALLRRYVYGLGLAPVAEVSAAGTRRFLHADAVGSVVAVTDAAGLVAERHGYGPYGEGASATGVAFRFTGHRYDPETGLYYMRARYYSASLGRFLSPDPIGYGDGPNLYRYVGNSPVSFVDPTGLLGTFAGEIGSAVWQFGQDTASWASNNPLDALQLGLDGAGTVPGLGEPADGLNALISLARGDYTGAALSAAAMVPFVGIAATGTRIVRAADNVGSSGGGRGYRTEPPASSYTNLIRD
ncbi:MAG: RHS repeat-associated core domain-containing protein, partial [Pseudomonadota bacterium]